MNYELFIAKRLTKSAKHKSSISSPIIKIAIVAISLGIIIMMIAIATGIGLQDKIRDKVAGFNGHVQITNFDNNNSEITLVPVSAEQSFYPDFNLVDGIRHIQAYATKPAIIKTETDFEGVVVKGVGQEYDWQFLQEYLIAGALPVFSDEFSEDVLLSEHISNRLQFKVGDEFNTFFLKEDISKPPSVRKFKVVGIYNSGMQEFDESVVFADLKQIQRLNKWKTNEVGGFEIFVNDFNMIRFKGDQIYAETPSELNTTTILSKYPGIFEWIKLFDNNIALIIIIMILVAGINMITALLVLILERTQMIGILKSLGSTNWSVRKLFLYNASYIILRGLFWGNLIGISLLLIQQYFGVITLDPDTYYVREAPVFISVGYIALLNIGTLLLCLLMLLIPSYIITKISPVKAIKFD
ncbi:MAG: transmembrane permease [Bacteroidetes bacterium MedPE-SWsnd-G1]|nr:MAG: transmembrane permease [Bacteroidetes bacterium MedPE-SWsnd-G1]